MATAATAAALAMALPAAQAADAERGAVLYLQLGGGTASCVSCHGPDPAANRNNILRAADDPVVLLKALGAVGVMGYLKPVLGDADIADLSAYLGRVAATAAAPLQAIWPRTIEFGQLPLGAASPVHSVYWHNRSDTAVAAPPPRLAAGRFEITHDCPASLPAGGRCRVQLQALAGSVGLAADTLVLGPAPGAVVGIAGAVADVNAAVAVLSTDADAGTLDFGRVTVGETATRRVVLRNAGTGTATLGVSTITGPGAPAFATDGACGPSTPIAAGATCTLTLRHQPTAAVAYEASLQWRSTGTHPQPLVLRASGSAATPAPPPALPPADGGAGGGGGSGGGCAAAAPARPGDASLPLLVALAAAAAAARRRHRRR